MRDHRQEISLLADVWRGLKNGLLHWTDASDTLRKEIVWQLHQDDLAPIRLGWVTTLEVLPSGNYVIGNCHAGEKQPLLIEIEPKTKKIVWTFDKYDLFGNSASNSQLLGEKDVIR